MLDYSLIGRNIRELRESQGISQQDFADAVGISKRHLSSIENGHTDNITLNTIARISELLNISISSLIDEKAQQNNIPTTSSGFEHIIDCSNYLYRNPYRKISTFVELFLILPLISLHDFYDITARVDGDIFGREDYVAQAVGYAYRSIPDSKAKSYVQTILDLIERQPWEGRTDISASDVLREKFEELCDSDDFIELHESYVRLIKEKAEITASLGHFVSSNRDYENKLI